MFNNIYVSPICLCERMMRRLVITWLMLSACLLFGQELDAIIASHGSHILGITPQDLLKETNLKRLTWNNQDKTQIRYSQKISGELFTFADIQIVEAIFHFPKRNKLASAQISLFNRGDCGEWPKERFEMNVKRLQNRITEMTKNRTPETSSRKLGGETTKQMMWRTPGYDMALRWSISDRGPEYITINLEPRGAIQKLSMDIKTSVKANELVRNIKKAGEDDFHTVHEFIHGEELKSFNYDR